MKHLIFFCMAMLCSLNSFAQYDLNGNGKIDIVDVSVMANRVLGINNDSIKSIKIFKNDELIETYTNTSSDKFRVEYEEYIEQLHEYVDLGLPSGTLWATCNIGADKPEDCGLYFAWGETVGYTIDEHSFDWSSYKLCNKSEKSLTKYCTDNTHGSADYHTVLDSLDDAATINWGTNWRTPTLKEWEELKDNSTHKWDSANNGIWVMSLNNKNKIFLPAAGFIEDSSIINFGTLGYYWSASINFMYDNRGYDYYFRADFNNWAENIRCYGLSIRPVRSSTK